MFPIENGESWVVGVSPIDYSRVLGLWRERRSCLLKMVYTEFKVRNLR